MIEYAIIEDRTASILLHAGITDKGWERKLSNKLNSIDLQIGKKHPIISKKVSADTIQGIRDELGTYAAVGRKMGRSANTVSRYIQMKGVPLPIQLAIRNLTDTKYLNSN